MNMKISFSLLFFAVLLTVTACGDDRGAGVQKRAQGTVMAPIAPNTHSTYVQTLLNNYWVYEYYVDSQDRSNQIPNKGRWYKFNPDGTFTGGQWQEQTHAGSWVLNIEDGTWVIYLDSNNDALDNQFFIQGLEPGAESTSWVGTSRFDNSHIIIKVINLLTMPTKAQFGVEEDPANAG